MLTLPARALPPAGGHHLHIHLHGASRDDIAALSCRYTRGSHCEEHRRDRRDVTMILAVVVLAFIAKGMFALAVTGWPA